MNLGYINFANTYPLYHHMMEIRPLPGLDIVSRYPAELNALMASGGLDMSPISAATYADLQDDVVLLPEICLACQGVVKSVMLVSNRPLPELDGARIGLSSASHTSVILLKILMEKQAGIRPNYVPSPPRPDLREMDAALVIGNEALEAETFQAPFVYDLGELWQRMTGQPVVFALIAVQRDFAGRHPGKVAAVRNSYRQSLDWARARRQEFLAATARHYPDLKTDLDAYFRVLKYDFSDPLKTALSLYFSLAAEQGLIPPVRNLNFLPPPGAERPS